MDDEEDSQEEEEEKEISLEDFLFNLRTREKNLESPINVNITNMQGIRLPELEWHHYELPPKKVKLTNSGHTAILSAKWFQERPFLTGGPFIGNYVFSQLHFHWGTNDMEGSEHTIDGIQYPVEMHCVHFRSAYLTQEHALLEKDGVAVLVFVLKLQSQTNPFLQELLDNFVNIQTAFTSIKLEANPISLLIPEFINDYFMYWGQIKTTNRNHLILWVICRTPIGISAEQIDYFRSLLDENEEPMIRNFRNIENVEDKLVYHVNSSDCKYSTLLPVPRIEIPKSKRK